MSAVVFEVGQRGKVHSAKILEFIMSGTARPATLTRYLTSYWREEFQGTRVSVAEFSIYYAPQRGRVFQAGEKPREARIDVRVSGAGKSHGVEGTCYYYIFCYEDPDTGEILWCDGDSISLLYCEGDGEEDGGAEATKRRKKRNVIAQMSTNVTWRTNTTIVVCGDIGLALNSTQCLSTCM